MHRGSSIDPEVRPGSQLPPRLPGLRRGFSRLARRLSFRQVMWLTAGCFVLVAFGVSGVAMVSRHYSQQGTRQTETLTDHFLPGLVTLARLQDSTLNLKSITFQLALARDDAAIQELTRAFLAYTEQVTRGVAELKARAHNDRLEELIAAFSANVQNFRAGAEKFQAQLRAGEFEQAMATLDQEVDPAQRRIEMQLRTLSERYFQLAHNAGSLTTALLLKSDRFGLLATIVLAGFTLLCLVLSLTATRIMLAQIQARDAERLAAQATLEHRVEERTADLRSSQERIRLIVGTASDAIITFDATSNVIDWNAQAEKIFGWSQAEAVGRDLRDTIISPARREAHDRRIQRFLSSRDSTELKQRIEATAVHRDGHELPVEVTISPAQLGNGVLFSAFIRDITEHKKTEAELRQIHRQLVETSRQAGMAEVATGVLHNVGNVLNSVNVCATLVTEQLAHSKSANLTKVAAMLEEHNGHVLDFLANDPKGRHIPGYLITLAGEVAKEQSSITGELGQLRQDIEHIKDIVAMQQSYAMVSGVTEQVAVSLLVEDALRINAGALVRHGLEVVRDYQADPVITVERHKVLQILVNLIRNAKYACDDSGGPDKRMTMRIAQAGDRVRLTVIDTGVGIPAENLTRIFAHGFTTRKNGHGFGLHSGALVAREMGGSLVASSAGPGQGATFTLEIPVVSAPALS